MSVDGSICLSPYSLSLMLPISLSLMPAMLGFLWDVFESTTESIGDAGEVRCAYQLGKGRPKLAELSSYKSMLIGLLTALSVTAVFLGLRDYLPYWLTQDTTIQGMLAELFPLMALGNIAMTTGMVCWALIGSQGRYRLATSVAFACSGLITIPIAAIVTIWLRIDLQGMTFAVVVGYTVTATLLSTFLLASDWERLSRQIMEVVATEEADDGSESSSSSSSSSSSTCCSVKEGVEMPPSANSSWFPDPEATQSKPSEATKPPEEARSCSRPGQEEGVSTTHQNRQSGSSQRELPRPNRLSRRSASEPAAAMSSTAFPFCKNEPSSKTGKCLDGVHCNEAAKTSLMRYCNDDNTGTSKENLSMQNNVLQTSNQRCFRSRLFPNTSPLPRQLLVRQCVDSGKSQKSINSSNSPLRHQSHNTIAINPSSNDTPHICDALQQPKLIEEGREEEGSCRSPSISSFSTSRVEFEDDNSVDEVSSSSRRHSEELLASSNATTEWPSSMEGNMRQVMCMSSKNESTLDDDAVDDAVRATLVTLSSTTSSTEGYPEPDCSDESEEFIVIRRGHDGRWWERKFESSAVWDEYVESKTTSTDRSFRPSGSMDELEGVECDRDESDEWKREESKKVSNLRSPTSVVVVAPPCG